MLQATAIMMKAAGASLAGAKHGRPCEFVTCRAGNSMRLQHVYREMQASNGGATVHFTKRGRVVSRGWSARACPVAL
jgi:hypothetical protein